MSLACETRIQGSRLDRPGNVYWSNLFVLWREHCLLFSLDNMAAGPSQSRDRFLWVNRKCPVGQIVVTWAQD
ncbi:hypothetical protein RRG08_055760 [Elysia crispata]|uniref:Uncharacterized protein n=1 Tax=Elysia crispata TaxID=231223 RepID=A0AAE1DV64_9GAST|nr:hypothetical protein RRG08_055760 [Elysia crispata]